MNKEFTQKDADELLNIEIMAKQLIERVQTLKAKFIDVEGEIKKKRKPTKWQLRKKEIELDVQRNWEKRMERHIKHHFANGEPCEKIIQWFPDKKEFIQRLANELQNKK